MREWQVMVTLVPARRILALPMGTIQSSTSGTSNSIP